MENLPIQKNNYDCGIFSLEYAEYRSKDAAVNFTQTNIPIEDQLRTNSAYFREKITQSQLFFLDR